MGGRDGGGMTAKDISKRMKARGLQRLRWYCQMCEKQCRDEVGFQSHCTSISHQTKMQEFASDPTHYVSKFSSDFQNAYVDTLRRRFGARKVRANDVYQEYIKDRDHVHMNATKWTTLAEFISEIAQKGLVRVEDPEGALFVSYVDREIIQQQKRAQKLERMKQLDQIRAEQIAEQQLRIALVQSEKDNDKSRQQSTAKRQLISVEEDGKRPRLIMSLKANSGKSAVVAKNAFRDYKKSTKLESSKDAVGPEPARNSSTWLSENLIVQEREIEGRKSGVLRGEKARVIRVIDDLNCEVELMTSHELISDVKCEFLQSVIPKIGRKVKIVKGEHKGEFGVLKEVNIESFNGSILLEKNELLVDFDYDSFCKIIE
mmetsp:Transcript_8311/g.15049  ORF Transcript_8311/g.15049 Transcript_8311/m.15049 type:complete len:373 (-) Transcript_8311:595-1713(-)|eukprot:CAMPEP_0182448028 /NCGR_PEP_ID=MMETSP1172-20130603/22852_1 /TAXON_ID=708627 /ORGANISM="Timspurckia oligopyrenoides, Strain CCMP3278" /LENGTH=372 /DNA_ID=CAMNT_0024644729 /DNA_START=44 /DNA_END=1162 /DNA_ORIENTATION=+